MENPAPHPGHLSAPLPEPALIESQVRIALAEDVAGGDLTAALLPAEQRSRVELITREAAVLCGQGWFDTVFRLLDPRVNVLWEAQDGEPIAPASACAPSRAPPAPS